MSVIFRTRICCYKCVVKFSRWTCVNFEDFELFLLGSSIGSSRWGEVSREINIGLWSVLRMCIFSVSSADL